MFPNMNETPFPAEAMQEGMVVFDTIYNPQNTLLIKQAKAAVAGSCTAATCSSSKRRCSANTFTGRTADKTVMAEALRRAINPAKYAD